MYSHSEGLAWVASVNPPIQNSAFWLTPIYTATCVDAIPNQNVFSVYVHRLSEVVLGLENFRSRRVQLTRETR